MTIGVGEPGVPQENGGPSGRWNTVWLYARMRGGSTSVSRSPTDSAGRIDGVLNHDLRKPALLAPLLGPDGLGPTRRNLDELRSRSRPGVDVVSGRENSSSARPPGANYRTHGLTSSMDAERVALGPPGLGGRISRAARF